MTREHLIAMPFDPDRRDAFELLPLLLREDAARGASALCALAASGHRGWVDLLLELEQEATRRGLHASWLASLLGCSERGRDLADAMDRDVRRAITRSARRAKSLACPLAACMSPTYTPPKQPQGDTHGIGDVWRKPSVRSVHGQEQEPPSRREDASADILSPRPPRARRYRMRWVSPGSRRAIERHGKRRAP